LTKIIFRDIVEQTSREIRRESESRVNIGISLILSFAQKQRKQRQNSGRFAVISPVEPSEAQDFRRARGAARCKFLEEQRKQRELTRKPGSISARGTGWSLSSGRPKAGPVGRYDKILCCEHWSADGW
jgi:hypothetical protein